jgi:hypothetical protein
VIVPKLFLGYLTESLNGLAEGQTGERSHPLWAYRFRRPEELDLIHQSQIQESPGHEGTALHQKAIEASFSELPQGMGKIDPAFRCREAVNHPDAGASIFLPG